MKENFDKYYIGVLKKYVVFQGRAGRKEYWMFVLFHIIISILLSILDRALGTEFGPNRNGIFSSLYSIAVLLPNLAVTIRRMHDTNHRGWWILFPIVNFVFLLTDSTPGDNKYGPNPKVATPAAPTPTAV